MDHLFAMRMFRRIVELGSFARASEEFDVARATATNTVAQLERKLGVRLLHRTTRKLSPTEDGRLYYESCVRILDDIAESEEMLSSSHKSPRGRLRVTVPHAFIHLIFFPALPKFLARYPELDLEVILTDSALNLVEQGIDCAVRGAEIPDDSTLVARRISRVRWMTCASPAYLKAHGTPRRHQDLDPAQCIRFLSPSTGRTSEWRFEVGGTRKTIVPKGRLGVTSMEAAATAAASGIGIAQVPEPVAMPELKAGRLKPVLLDEIAEGPTLTVVYPSSRYLTAKVKVFADFIAEIFPAERWGLD